MTLFRLTSGDVARIFATWYKILWSRELKKYFVLICSRCDTEHLTQGFAEQSGLFKAVDVRADGAPDGLEILHKSGDGYVFLHGGVGELLLAGV